MAEPERTIYRFSALDSLGQDVSMERFRGRVLLVVNVASKCALTQCNYSQLKELKSRFGERGLDLALFPCNQFGGQVGGGAGRQRSSSVPVSRLGSRRANRPGAIEN